MPKTFPPAWIRIAGNAANIKARAAAHWRCFVKREPPEIPIVTWQIVGFTTPENFIPGTATNRDALGLNAWIDIYGRLTIDDNGIASIELLDPV